MGWKHRRRRWIPWTIVAILLLALLVAIDDPLRDFTRNDARIAEDSEDPTLRPLVVRGSAGDLIATTRRAARRVKNWEYIGTARVGDATTLVFERTSRLWRFKNDITIRVEDLGGQCRLTGESRSRLPYGDLGQNPRNLRRILAELAVVLEDGSQTGR